MSGQADHQGVVMQVGPETLGRCGPVTAACSRLYARRSRQRRVRTCSAPTPVSASARVSGFNQRRTTDRRLVGHIGPPPRRQGCAHDIHAISCQEASLSAILVMCGDGPPPDSCAIQREPALSDAIGESRQSHRSRKPLQPPRFSVLDRNHARNESSDPPRSVTRRARNRGSP